MSTLAEKLADAWIKRDLIQLKSDELQKIERILTQFKNNSTLS